MAFHPLMEADMYLALLAVVVVMGLALVKVRRQRKVREAGQVQAH
jgi:hypothetical protein